ncbi:hypothetical protein HYQ46_002796 [Verticillium longisporum]|nr:hypothetical protein HYQ46_002796 [Verticillium longisporum]
MYNWVLKTQKWKDVRTSSLQFGRQFFAQAELLELAARESLHRWMSSGVTSAGIQHWVVSSPVKKIDIEDSRQ